MLEARCVTARKAGRGVKLEPRVGAAGHGSPRLIDSARLKSRIGLPVRELSWTSLLTCGRGAYAALYALRRP